MKRTRRFPSLLWALMALAVAFPTLAPQAELPTSPLPSTPRARGDPTPGKRALLVGVSGYARPGRADDWGELNTATDVRELSRVLRERFGFSKDEIRILTTKGETTGASIVRTFREFLIEPTRRGDIVYFHFSGHGHQAPDDDDEEIDGLDETLVPSDYASRNDASKDIRDDTIRRLLAELAAKQPGNVTLSFDCCHSGTNTRAGRMTVRGGSWRGPVPQPSTTTAKPSAEGAGGLFARGAASATGYVVISAARADQTAKETPDEPRMGMLSRSLVQALQKATPGTTYRDLFERVASEVAYLVSDQHPQFEGDLDQLLFKGIARPVQPYFTVGVSAFRGPFLNGGQLQGMTVDSRFSIWPAATKSFDDVEPVAEATIVELDLNRAYLQLEVPDGRTLPKSALENARAVETLHHYGDNRLRVDLDALDALEQGARIRGTIAALPLVNADLGPRGAYDVRVLPGDDRLALERADGTVIDEVAVQEIDKLRRALEGESRWRFVQSLQNEEPYGLIRVDLRIVPVDVTSDEQCRIKVVRDRRLSYTDGGHLRLPVGTHYQLEVRNVGTEPAYFTVLNLRIDGRIGPLFPHPDLKEKGDNKVPPDGKWHRIRHPRCPVVFRTEGAGSEVLKLIATREDVDFSPLVDPDASSTRGDPPGGSVAKTPLGQLLAAVTTGRRSAAAPIRREDWATADVRLTIVEGQ